MPFKSSLIKAKKMYLLLKKKSDNGLFFFGAELNYLTILQMISVFFGTVMAAPLMVSKKPNKRIIGYLAMTIGCIAAILVQVSVGLYIFILANLYWVLNSVIAIRKNSKPKK